MYSVYKEELFIPLIDTLEAKGHENSIAILGITRAFAKESFVDMLRARGFRYKKIPTSSMILSPNHSAAHDLSEIAIIIITRSPYTVNM